jgi:hypothetical protein
MANFNFNGLINPVLPNIYISKVSLEGDNAATNKIAANRQSVIEMHIQPRQSDGGWHGNPTADDYINKSKLTATYDMLIETHEVYGDLEGFVDDIFSFIKVHLITFKGTKGKFAYKHLIGSMDGSEMFGSLNMGSLIHGENSPNNPSGLEKNAPWPAEFGDLSPDIDYKYSSKTLDKIIETSSFTGGEIDPEKATVKRRDFIKQKFQHILPDGSVIYKIPVRIKQDIQGTAFPNDLACIAVCSLDVHQIFANVSYNTEDAHDFDVTWNESAGRTAGEVLIANGRTPKQGMIFFISTNQDTDVLGNSKFDNIMGDLWLGGVHKHGSRFMAGNTHDPNTDHPFLDYLMVDSKLVQDFRQLSQIKKQIINFNPEKSAITGANYVNNQLSSLPSANFDNLACFGDLIQTANTSRQVKMSFCIDWGKLVKKNCLMPAVLDSLASQYPELMQPFFDKKGMPNILSFKIYRRRVDAKNDVINDTGEKLIYDGYPNIYYTSEFGKTIIKNDNIASYKPNVKSALVPLKLKYSLADAGFNGHMSHYTFTDYDIGTIARGTYEYSVEVEITDPTLSLFVDLYANIISGVNEMKPFVSFVNGGLNSLKSATANENIFNSATGQFTTKAKNFILENNWNAIGEVQQAIIAVATFSGIAGKTNNTDFFVKAANLLDPESATPDSINLVSDVLISVADKIKSIIDSFSTANIPKINSFADAGIKEKSLEGKTIVATIPKRKIKVKHAFSKKTEHAMTTDLDGGYDFLANPSTQWGLKNLTTFQIGLRSVLFRDYMLRSNKEVKEYFPNWNLVSPISMTLPLLVPNMQTSTINASANSGRYLKVHPGSVKLPKYIVDHSNNKEHHSWMVVNNVLRYKMGLHGDSGADHSLGYGPNDKINGSEKISAQMERILKEYQTLAQRGIYFPQSTWDVNAWNEDQIGVGAADIGNSEVDWEQMKNNPLPAEAGVTLEKTKNSMSSDALMKMQQLPWAQNYGQEKLLLCLINGTFAPTTTLNMKLGAFDTALKGSPIEKYINQFYDYVIDMGASAGEAAAATAVEIQSLPHHIAALLANLHPNTRELLTLQGANQNNPDGDGQYAYFSQYPTSANKGLYEPPKGTISTVAPDITLVQEESIEDQNMRLHKFGQFWFDHMNLVEVQYLSGYETTQKAVESKPDYFLDDPEYSNKSGVKYEDVYNGSVKAPVWKPLTVNIAGALLDDADNNAAGQQNHILCRLVRKKYNFFGQAAYNAFDLPVYDEYFLITSDTQVGGPKKPQIPRYNAYVDGYPTEKISAADPSLQMVMGLDMNSEYILEEVGDDTEDIEIGEIDL